LLPGWFLHFVVEDDMSQKQWRTSAGYRSRRELGQESAEWLPYFRTTEERSDYETCLQEKLHDLLRFPAEVTMGVRLARKRDILLHQHERHAPELLTREGLQIYVINSDNDVEALLDVAQDMLDRLCYPAGHSWKTLKPNNWMKVIGHSPTDIAPVQPPPPQVKTSWLLLHIAPVLTSPSPLYFNSTPNTLLDFAIKHWIVLYASLCWVTWQAEYLARTVATNIWKTTGQN
jgi:hypothetical protein